MERVKNDFDRILNKGGAFVIFADASLPQEVILAKVVYNNLSERSTIQSNSWSFLSILKDVFVEKTQGNEIIPEEIKSPLIKPLLTLLANHTKEAEFKCALTPIRPLANRWLTLAENKYGMNVAGLVQPPDKSKTGWVFIFPNLGNKAEFLSTFLKSILPEICPLLFPETEGKNWVHRDQYELPPVKEKLQELERFKAESESKILELEGGIAAQRRDHQFMYDLICGTGNELVAAVFKALILIGFESVVDVDEEEKRASLREDLRIHDRSPVLVVDVKGIGGKPADAEALQAQKHTIIFMKENDRTDVQGLTVINHERFIPALDRENEMPYRQEIIDNAEQVGLGLMTGWDLFRIVRNMSLNKWRSEELKPIFYQIGRIHPIPVHYEHIGEVNKVWEKAFSINLKNGEIGIGQTISIEFPVDFEEQKVSSLRLDDADVKVANAPSEVGIGRDDGLPKVRKGMSVYRIKV